MLIHGRFYEPFGDDKRVESFLYILLFFLTFLYASNVGYKYTQLWYSFARSINLYTI
jgi:hypothetical protein